MSNASETLDYAVDFNPRDYLDEYYGQPDKEDHFVVNFMAQAVKQMPPDLLALELGGGPTLFAVATLAGYVAQIHFCDYVQANLTEVQLWLDDDPAAFNWQPYIEMTLQQEGRSATPAAVAVRAAQMRRKLTKLLHCDALSPTPLGCHPSEKYGLVVAQTSTDAVSNTVAEWRQVMQNITSLVTPGGWLLISVITGADQYRVGELNFPCMNLTEADITAGYEAAGYEPDSIQLARLTVADQRDYSGITSAVARKRR